MSLFALVSVDQLQAAVTASQLMFHSGKLDRFAFLKFGKLVEKLQYRSDTSVGFTVGL
jgi:hypothetical protein